MEIGQNRVEKLLEAIFNYRDLLELKDRVEKKLKETKEKSDNCEIYLEDRVKEQESLVSKLNEEIEGWKRVSFEFVSLFPVGKISENLTIEDNLIAQSTSGNIRERIAIYNGQAIAKFSYIAAERSKRSVSYFGPN